MMELQSCSFSQIITFFFFFLLFLLFRLATKQRRISKTPVTIQKWPPGPRKLPLIGNIHQLVGSTTHHTLRDLSRKHGPLMHLRLGQISAIVVSSPRLAKLVMKTHDHSFADRPELLAAKILCYDKGDIAFAPYGDYWRQMRRICTLELLSTKNVRSFHSIREEGVWSLVASIRSSPPRSPPINVTEKLFSMSILIICRSAFGKEEFEEQEALVVLVREAVELLGGFDLADLFPSVKLIHGVSRMKPRLLKIRKEAGEIIEKLMKERRENVVMGTIMGNGVTESREENLLDVLLRHQQGDGLDLPITDDNIKGIIFDLFMAGTDTSSVTVDWAITEMLRNPRVMEKALDELRTALKGKQRVHDTDIQRLSYLKLVIKETLRLHSPGPLLFPRECREACEIDGYNIPIKTHILINAWAIGRDPEHWQDAESFVPERFEDSSIDFTGTCFEYIPFGAGRRMCPGIAYGLATVELALAQLLYHFNWKLPDGMKPEDLDMAETCGSFARKRNDLYLIPTPYDPSFTQ